MKRIALAVASAGVAAVAASGVGAAVPLTGSVADVVKDLQDQGYSVQLNGPVSGPLARFWVTGVHGLVVMMPDGSLMMKMDPANPGDVFVDVSCPSSNN